MLRSAAPELDLDAVRFSAADALEKYVAGAPLLSGVVSRSNALEECFFLGLRLNRGVNLREVAADLGDEAVESVRATIAELVQDGLLSVEGDRIRLTSRGRLLSNEVFQRFLVENEAEDEVVR